MRPLLVDTMVPLQTIILNEGKWTSRTRNTVSKTIEGRKRQRKMETKSDQIVNLIISL